jgi:hypothetical protein
MYSTNIHTVLALLFSAFPSDEIADQVNSQSGNLREQIKQLETGRRSSGGSHLEKIGVGEPEN